jgi:hypothetical protein
MFRMAQPHSQIARRRARCFHFARGGTAMPKLSEGDTVSMTGEVTLVHDDGTVTEWLPGYDVPVRTQSGHLSLFAKRSGKAKRLRDVPD